MIQTVATSKNPWYSKHIRSIDQDEGSQHERKSIYTAVWEGAGAAALYDHRNQRSGDLSSLYWRPVLNEKRRIL